MYQKINDTTFERITEVRQVITLKELNELLKIAKERVFKAQEEADAIQREIDELKNIGAKYIIDEVKEI